MAEDLGTPYFVNLAGGHRDVELRGNMRATPMHRADRRSLPWNHLGTATPSGKKTVSQTISIANIERQRREG